jgi:N-methylhydantoinase A
MGMWVGVDVGGTFTDVMVRSASGALHMVKAATTPASPEQGMLNALEKAATHLGLKLDAFLDEVDVLVHGSTIATNALLEGKVARVGLLCTEGFKDTLTIRRGKRDYVWDFRSPYSAELVPRHLRREIKERVTRDGSIRRAADGAEAISAVQQLLADGVAAVAVSFLHSYLNPENESRVALAIRETFPDLFLSISSELAPIIGEYERTSTTAANAAIGPATSRYLLNLAAKLRQRGFKKPLLVSLSNGGFAPAAEAAAKPIHLVLSGPAAGVVAARLYADCISRKGTIFFDMGGTSTDITISGAQDAELTMDIQVGGYHLAVPSVNIRTVGTGGGAQAYVDSAGMLHVGPQSAGADPGPACYCRGGELPTVTDANLVLGRLNPDNFLGGEIRLFKKLATEAIHSHVAKPLNLTLEAAAAGIVRLANQHMCDAVMLAIAEGGYDPRSFALVAAGGAGGLHASSLASMIGISTVYIPRYAAVSCALGMIFSQIRHDYVRSLLASAQNADVALIHDALVMLERRAREDLQREGVTPDQATTAPFLSMRYQGQQWDLEVPTSTPFTQQSLDFAVALFHQKHLQVYGHQQLSGKVEIRSLRVQGLGPSPGSSLPEVSKTIPVTASDTFRSVYTDDLGWVQCRLVTGRFASPETSIQGPAVIEEDTTTIFLKAGDRCIVDRFGNYLVTVGTPERH